VRARRRSAAPWLVVPALLSVGVIGAKRWSKADPLLAGARRERAGAILLAPGVTAAVDREARPCAPGLSGAGMSLEGRDSCGARFQDLSASTLARPADQADSRVTPSQPAAEGGLDAADTRRAVDELGGQFALVEDARRGSTPQHALCVGAEQRVTVLGEGVVPHEVVDLVQQMGPGPWQVDLRYRGLVVIREEAP
jgi:hypothetical protein